METDLSTSNNLKNSPEKRTKVRTIVFLLIFVAITINYMDRVNFAVAVPVIQKQFGFSIGKMGQISFAWGIVYALFNFPGGWIADRLGLRKAFSFALGWWSIFTIVTALAYNFGSWMIIRALMGLGEAPVWPLNAKATHDWASTTERSKAFTLAGSGQFVGPAFGTILAGWIVTAFGWQWAFISFGVLGLIWIPIWFVLVRDVPASHPWVNQAELRFIQGMSGASSTEKTTATRGDFIVALRAIASRNGIGVFITFLTFGYILFTFLYWLPSYMYFVFHLSIIKSAAWATVAYLGGFIGFLISGPINDYLIVRFGRGVGRKMGAGIPMVLMVLMMLGALQTSRDHLVAATVILMGLSMLVMNASVGAWAVNAIDLAPSVRNSAFVYGIYNGVLNLMGAFNSLILTWIAGQHGFIAAFLSAIAFMIVFLIGLIFVIDKRGIIPSEGGI